jgi:hypothetical protein
MKAILRTYHNELSFTDDVVEIDDNHDFSNGPYQDTVPFAVGSNQTILELDESIVNPEARTNAARKRKVAQAILDYSPGEGAREAFIDLLTDALHLFGEEQVRFHLDWALEHYHAETGEVLAS